MQPLEQRLDPSHLQFLKCWVRTPLPSSPSDLMLVYAVLQDKGVAERISTRNDSQPDGGHFSVSRRCNVRPTQGGPQGVPGLGPQDSGALFRL